MKPVSEIALEFLSRGGKRLRPRLCRLVYEAFGAGRSGEALDPVCEAVECFHKASLIHDDIQDGAAERYGAPAVHVEYGIPLAIAAGDWLVAHGYRLIAEAPFDAPAMLSACVRSHQELCEGQGDELAFREAAGEGALPGKDALVSIYRRKTGEAFALAAELGAIAAGADARAAQAMRSFGLDYGVAFQIRDDRADSDGALSLEDENAALASAFAALAPYAAVKEAVERLAF